MHDLEKSCGWQPFTSVCRRIHPDTFMTGSSARYLCIRRQYELEWCIDDERQFKTVKRSQAPGDANVLKQLFPDNFVIFRRWSKRIAFLESVNFSMCAICKFSIFVMFTWPLFGTLQGPISPKCLFTDSADYVTKVKSLGFPSVPLVWVKLFPVCCAQDRRKVP